jgi:hypothetical protein
MSVSDKISTLWVVVMFNMAFADILGFIDPTMQAVIAAASTDGLSFGNIEGVVITPTMLLVAAVFIEVAVLMIYLSRTLQRRANRTANFVATGITAVFILGGGSLQPHYIFFASIELACLAYIVILSRSWSTR